MRFVNRNNAREVALALFLLPIAGTKEKAKQKENAVEGEFRRLRAATEGSAFGNRKPLKRLEPNFKKGVGRLSPTFLPTSAPGEFFTLQ